VTTGKVSETKLLIVNTAVVTVDNDFTIFDPGWISIDGENISGVGPGDPPKEIRRQAAKIIDASGSVTIPGMINAHTHLFQTFFRGLADDKSLIDWLKECIWPGAVHLDASTAELAAKVGMIENLRSGATSIIDHQYIHIDEKIDDAICSAADELGIRFLLARGWADRNYEPSLTETSEQVIDRTQRIRRKWHGLNNDRIRVELAPLIPWGCSDKAMTATVQESRSWGGGTHIHCAETQIEVEMSLEERGMRHVEWLDHLGLLGPDTQLVHSVWLDDQEIELIAKKNAVVVHCPVSNMYLASGVPRILDMLSKDIPVALASDGPGSNNRQDMFEVLKSTVLLQKVHNLDPMALQPEDALRMACTGGAVAFGKSDEIGSISKGLKADLVVVDLETVFSSPVHSIPSALVFCSSPAQVRHVIVDGELLIEDAKLSNIDEQSLLAEAETAARALFKRAGIQSRLTEK
jgi:5-methylthioadenosine/S-adenosylhomocysteine deaminase